MTKQEILGIVSGTTPQDQLDNAKAYLVSTGIMPNDSQVITTAKEALKAVLAEPALLLDTINVKAGSNDLSS